MKTSAQLACFLCHPAASLHPARRAQLTVWGLPENAVPMLWRKRALSLFLLRRFELLPATALDMEALPRRCFLLPHDALELACLKLGLARHHAVLRRVIAGEQRRALAHSLGAEAIDFVRALAPDLRPPACASFPARADVLAHGRDLLLAAADVPSEWRRRLWLKLPPNLPPVAELPAPSPSLLEQVFTEKC